MRTATLFTPNRLDAKDDAGFHHTTAADLAKIMKYCIKESLKSDEFLEITRTAQYSFSDVEGKCTYQCTNHNAFLQMMEGALSGKTGFTGIAGYCYVGALQREDKTLIVALLACGSPNNKTYKWSDTRKLMNYGLEQFKKIDLLQIEPDEAGACAHRGAGRTGRKNRRNGVFKTGCQELCREEELSWRR